MIQYDKVPISPDRMSTVTAMLRGTDMALFIQCVVDKVHAAQLDAANLRYEASKVSATPVGTKKMDMARLADERAMRMASFVHILQEFVANPELETLKIS